MHKCYDCLHFKFLRVTKENKTRILKRFHSTLKIENLIKDQGFANMFFCAIGRSKLEVYVEHNDFDHVTQPHNDEGLRIVLGLICQEPRLFVDNSPMTEEERSAAVEENNKKKGVSVDGKR